MTTPAVSGMLKGRVSSSTLPNGFRLYAMRKPEAAAVTVQLWVATGSVNEGKNLGCGLSHFLEHMLFQGAGKYAGLAIADTVHSLGGDINAYTSYNCTVYYISLPAKSFAKAVDMLAAMAMKPQLPKTRFKLEKGVILRERDMNLDRPERVLSENLWREMFQQHPLRHPIIGYREKIESVERDMAAEYHALRYTPGRSFLVVVGDVPEEEALKVGSDAFSSWPMGLLEEPSLPGEPQQCCRREWTSNFHDPLARVSTGWHVPDASHPDVPALDTLSAILGGSASSRLHKRLKVELELALGVSAYNYSTAFQGVAGFCAVCPPEKMRQMTDASLELIREVRESDVTEQELVRNVAQQSAEYIRSLRDNSGVARIIGGSVLTFGSPDFADKYIADLSSLTVADLRRVASTYFADAGLTIATLLPDSFKESTTSVKATSGKTEGPTLKTAPAGQRMIHFEDKSLPLVEFCAVLPGGLIWEPKGLSGVSRLLSSCLSCGTDKLSEMALAELLDDEAADFSAISGNNSLCIRLNCRKERLDKALDAIASLLAAPAIPKQQFDRERRNFLDSLASRKSIPQSVAEDTLCGALFGKHPYAPQIGATEKSPAGLSDELVRKFHSERCLIPSKAVFGFAGDISSSEAFERMERMIASCTWNTNGKLILPPEPSFPASAKSLKVQLDKQQAVLMLAMPSCPNVSADRNALELLHSASNSQSSKLFKSVREDKGLAYYTGLILATGIHSGYLSYYAGTSPETASKVEELLEKERQRVASHGLSKEEFSAARECLLYDLAEEMQNTGRLLLSSALAEFYDLGFMSPWQRPGELAKLTRKEVNEAIARYLSSETQVSVLVSPETKQACP